MNIGFIDWVDGIPLNFLCRVSDSTNWVSQELGLSSPPSFSLLSVALNLFYISWTLLYISMSSNIWQLARIPIRLHNDHGPHRGLIFLPADPSFPKSNTIWYVDGSNQLFPDILSLISLVPSIAQYVFVDGVKCNSFYAWHWTLFLLVWMRAHQSDNLLVGL